MTIIGEKNNEKRKEDKDGRERACDGEKMIADDDICKKKNNVRTEDNDGRERLR